QRHPDAQLIEKIGLLARVFRPSGPVDRQDLFSGRIEQLAAVQSIRAEAGQHGVIYGERGAGKTSLAAVSSDIASSTCISMRINCDPGDQFPGLWEKVIDEL